MKVTLSVAFVAVALGLPGAIVGCSDAAPPSEPSEGPRSVEGPEGVSEDPLVARPFDATHVHVRAAGRHDRLELAFAFAAQRRHPRPPKPTKNGDWSYNVGGQVNGGTSVYITNQITGTPSCTDMLYVPVNATGTNLYAFTNLYDTCTNVTTDPKCSPSPAGHCPTVSWTWASGSGTFNRNSVTSSLDGKTIYVSTTAGKLVALNTAPTASPRIAWTFDAVTNTGSANATFVGSAAWVNYSTGTLYTAVQYGTPSNIRLYKLSPTGAQIAPALTIANDGIASGVLEWEGKVYFGSTSGKLYKINDNGTTLTQAAAPWPLALTAEDCDTGCLNPIPVTGKAIYGTPTIDGLNNLLFVSLNNVMWSVRLGGATDGQTHSSELGWQNGIQARAGDVSCYTSPMLYADATTTQAVFVAHGKNQNDIGAGAGPRIHRRTYQNDGTFDTNNLTSGIVGTGTDLTYPRSSPLIFQPTPTSPVWVYVGDNAGTLRRFVYTNAGFGTETDFTIPSNPQSIESPVLVDTSNGNLYFGSNNGRVYQINQTSLL